MDNEFLIKQLKTLHALEPDPVFLRWSRRAILSTAQEPVERLIFANIMQRIAFPKFVFPLTATSIAALILIITASGNIVKPQSPEKNQIIASLNQETILREEQNIAPKNKLTEVAYYKNVTPAITLALNDIIDPSTNWKSSEHIKQIVERYNEK